MKVRIVLFIVTLCGYTQLAAWNLKNESGAALEYKLKAKSGNETGWMKIAPNDTSVLFLQLYDPTVAISVKNQSEVVETPLSLLMLGGYNEKDLDPSEAEEARKNMLSGRGGAGGVVQLTIGKDLKVTEQF